MDESGLCNSKRRLSFLLVTAHDVSYNVGFLCSVVNEAYCKRHGYDFLRVVQAKEDMSKLSSGRHLAWGKVALLRHLLQGREQLVPGCEKLGVRAEDFDYIAWIDADAMILNHALKLEELVSVAQNADFIIGEDMADTDFLNTGLMLFRTSSSWCQDLLQQWWDDSDVRWHHEVCWDQTGLCSLLQAKGILHQKERWFSWYGGPRHKLLHNSFVYDCGSFNFKYINNCKFVFHAVGERELLFSFSRRLLLKKDRIYAAVHDGFVTGGQDFEESPDLGGLLFSVQADHVEEASSQLQRAMQFWRAFGISRSGMQGQPPPCGWGCQKPALCEEAACLMRSPPSTAVQELRAAGKPVCVSAFANLGTEHQHQLSVQNLVEVLGEMPVKLERQAATGAGTSAPMMCSTRFWQLWDYAASCPPPFSPLSCTNKEPWFLSGWRPWKFSQQSAQLLEVAALLTSWLRQACRLKHAYLLTTGHHVACCCPWA